MHKIPPGFSLKLKGVTEKISKFVVTLGMVMVRLLGKSVRDVLAQRKIDPSFRYSVRYHNWVIDVRRLLLTVFLFCD